MQRLVFRYSIYQLVSIFLSRNSFSPIYYDSYIYTHGHFNLSNETHYDYIHIGVRFCLDTLGQAIDYRGALCCLVVISEVTSDLYKDS